MVVDGLGSDKILVPRRGEQHQEVRVEQGSNLLSSQFGHIFCMTHDMQTTLHSQKQR